VFEVGEADYPGKPSVIGRRSYIDENQLEKCQVCSLNTNMHKMRYIRYKCNSVTCAALTSDVQTCKWFLKVLFSKDGLEANPKDLEALTDLAFPGSLRSMQSFLGSLNYYSRFIEDYAIYAAVLYELREVDFAAMSKDDVRIQITRSMEHKELDQLDLKEDPGSDPKPKASESSDPGRLDGDKSFGYCVGIYGNPKLGKGSEDEPLVVGFATKARGCGDPLVQEYDQIYYPVTFVSRTLKSNELNYSPVEKEVLALLRILDLGYNMLVGRRIRVLTRYSTSTGLQGRLGQWASLLSPWTLEIVKCVKGEEEILGVIAASITPRSRVDEALIQISPKKEPRRKIQAPIPVIQAEEELTVDRKRVVFCGDSNLVIRQVRGEIECKAPGLTLLKQKALDRLKSWPDHELVHVKRDWNG
ncbi:Reverse transcriptase, partial [Phytophthora palmivora]